MKRLLLAFIFGTLIFISSSFPQRCGASILLIEIAFDKKVKPPGEANYHLYYLLPKNESNLEFEEMALFVSEFYYGKSDTNNSRFWSIRRNVSKLLEVEKSKAEEYIENYKLDDYKVSVNSYFRQAIRFSWEQNHEKQLKGKTLNGILEFKTDEMDDIRFLLRIDAEGFDPQHFLGAFLGG